VRLTINTVSTEPRAVQVEARTFDMTRRQAELLGGTVGLALLVPIALLLRYIGLPSWTWLTIVIAVLIGAALVTTDLLLSRGWTGAVISVLGVAVLFLTFPIERLMLRQVSHPWVDVVMVVSLSINAVAVLIIIIGVIIGLRRRPSTE